MKPRTKKVLKHPGNILAIVVARTCTFLNDETFTKIVYFLRMRRRLNLANPQTYNEKLNWLKLNYHCHEHTMLVDKVRVKDFVRQKIGEEHVIPTLGVWKSFDEIDFDKLPNQFVLKCNHDSGGLVICKDKSKLDVAHTRKIITKSLRTDFYKKGKEWPYKNVPRLILAEKYMEDETGELRDFKFFCFNGKVKALFVATERQNNCNEDVKFDFFDEEFNHLQLRQGHPNAKIPPSKPSHFEDMVQLAEKLSVGIPHVRVDFYNINGCVYFGEMTFFHHGGWTRFEPNEWDYKFGSWLTLPSPRMDS